MKLGKTLAFVKQILVFIGLAGSLGELAKAQHVSSPVTYSYPSTTTVNDVVKTRGFYSPYEETEAISSDSLTQQRTAEGRHVWFDSRYSLTSIQSARQSAAQFRLLAQTSNAIVAKTANENSDYAEHWANLAETYNALSTQLTNASTNLELTKRDFEDVQAKLTHDGLTPTIGLLLQHKREQLDALRVDDSLTLFATREFGRLRQRQLELHIVRHDGSEPASQTAEILAEGGFNPNQAQFSAVSSQIQTLLQQRKEWLRVLQQGYDDYQQKLSELDSMTASTKQLVTDYRTLIDRHVIWIRSGNPWSITDWRDTKSGVLSFFDERRTVDFGYAINRKWETNSLGAIGLVAFIVLVMLARWRAKSWLVAIGSRKAMRESNANSRKVAASILTILIASAIPSILYGIARWLGDGPLFEATRYSSSGFYAASMVALLIEIPRQLLCNFGYLDKHVEIELPRRERAHAYLTLVGFGLVLASYMVTVAGLIDHGMWQDSMTRVAFIAALFLVGWTFHLTLRPIGGFLEPLIAAFGGAVIHRLRFVLYLLGVGFPLAIICLSLLGYGFTANVFVFRGIVTLICFMIAATLWSPIKILSARFWQVLTGTTPPRRFDQYGEIPSESVSGVLAEHCLELKHQLAFLSQCALALAALVGFGWLWIDVFPNVKLGNPVVWSVQNTVTQPFVDVNGKTINRAMDEMRPITAMHLVLAAVAIFVAFQLSKLLPSMFDALVLQRVSFDEGMEHLVLILGRTLLFGAGCFIACSLIGLSWQTIQWLAVGLTIGVGFGLQDMVRNVLGGFVVLFEKPARLGDLITVGKFTGRVAAQRFRTTVLSDDDGREVIVPNKNFVNEEVVHWMGSGRLNVIPIEVAIKRDVRSADICRTLQELVIELPEVLLTPAPQATLVCVGQAAQRIEVRAWIEDGHSAERFRDSMLKVVSKYLREKDLLTATQPSQPSMSGAGDDAATGPFRSLSNRNRKRTA